jgi:predicted permease
MVALYDALLPVVGLIAAGYLAGHRNWVDPDGARQLAALGFSLLCPALLFRTMGSMSLDLSALTAVLGYLGAEALIFGAVALILGRSDHAVVLAMTSTFGNTVMIGIPLIGLAFGEQGLVVLLAIVSAHSVLMLTVVTVSLEWLGRRSTGSERPARVAAQALRQAVLHPITLPILLGLAWGQTGWTLPPLLDRPLQWLGQAFSPIALLMVGISLAHIVKRTRTAEPGADTRRQLLHRGLGFTFLKNLLHPLLAGLICLALGLRGLPVAVTVAAAALPIGATVLIFAQRYRIGVDQATTAIAVSTFAALATLPVALTASAWLR